MNEEQIAKLANHLSIENFHKNTSVNRQESRDIGLHNTSERSFVRSGKPSVIRWQKEYTPEIVERVKSWMDKNLADTTLRFPECSQ